MSQHTVSIEDFFFAPADLTISRGDTVVWMNNGSVNHTASRDDTPPFDTGILAPGATSQPVEFDSVPGGPLTYFCRPHKAMMEGTITVT